MPRRKVSHLTLHDIKLVHNAIVAWVSLLRTLPVLQSLSMRFPSGLPDFELQHAVLEALKASPNSVACPLPALRNLSLQNVHHGHPSPFVDVLSCANPYPHLTHLFLSTPPCFYTPSKVTEFWMQGVLPVLRCCSATLTALTLKSVEEIGFPTVVFDGIYFPHLTNLSLARVLFDEKTGTEGFILRHAPTLSFLELIGCKAVMITDMPTPGPSYTWEKIYKSFALDLQSLSILVISPDTMHDSDDEDAAVVQDITYTQRSAVEEWNMHHFDDYRPPPWLEADAVALAELSKSVSERWERSIQE
ncbi:hypothetical protein FA95DRAFT_1559193 [Auriscalpium vulgare]|uniref:Uncharacterized protein n=1 Tax=Auriscalpium vulgare TaxID=40419 RepID=A0ACB8RTB0_9AGAM|nr:hypothetical protein FA95DRAFT_1559193 [Auriscalpium vulgare]